jgi:phosphoribosyl 1,2-cyclic phosphodiesterase
MKIKFLGTRGYIKLCSLQHRRHSSLLLTHKGKKIMIDCGTDWLGMIGSISPDAIFISHAHPDHAWGLAGGADCPVYATEESWSAMANFPLDTRRMVPPRKPVEIHGFSFEAFPVIHSIRAPAVGYRISAGRASSFYVPDVIDIVDRKAALSGIRLYVGDGAALVRPIVRHAGKQLFGHTTVRAQIGWCEQCGVGRALFTHCGSEIVSGDDKAMQSRVREMGLERTIDAAIAFDGMEVMLR